MRDVSIADYFSEGLRTELDSIYWIRSTRYDYARFRLHVRITDCDLHTTSSGCNVRFYEQLTLSHIPTNDVVLEEKWQVEVPLRYCGKASDSVSLSGEALSSERYSHLALEEQISALQCAAFDAGADLADSLASRADRVRPTASRALK